MMPPRIIEGLREYVEGHRNPGDFLRAVLENNFAEAVLRADPESLAAIREIAECVYDQVPANCWGGRDKVRCWLAKRET